MNKGGNIQILVMVSERLTASLEDKIGTYVGCLYTLITLSSESGACYLIFKDPKSFLNQMMIVFNLS